MFTPQCRPILIGSLPVTDHEEAVKIIFDHTPEIPLWPQLPKRKGEGMIRQFLGGFPGLEEDGSRYWINTEAPAFAEQMASFYEEYMDIEAEPHLLRNSRFKLSDDTARGFHVFTDYLVKEKCPVITLKGQITGPITTGIGVKNQHNSSIFYDDNLRDMLCKHLALKGRWQAEELMRFKDDAAPIVFIDEPGIVSYGSSAFLGVTRKLVSETVAEVIAGIHSGGGLAGVHICANGDWGPVLSSDADIISFDAFFYFDNFILYRDQLVDFLRSGGFLAWGIIPTGDPQILDTMSSELLFQKLETQIATVMQFGFSRKQLLQQVFIAPSCGTGSLSPAHALKVLKLTAEVSYRAQEMYHNC